MTLHRFAIAGMCFLFGTTAGFAVAKLSQDTPLIAASIPSEGELIQPDESVTSDVLRSPFVVESDEADLAATSFPASENATPTDETNSGNTDAIDYMQLADYQHLLNTLNRIDGANESLIFRWIDQAPVSNESMSVSRIVNRALFQKLSALQPSLAVTWIEQRAEKASEYYEDGLLSDAVAGYSLAHPTEAENWLATLDPYGSQQLLVFSMRTTLGGMNPERMLAQLSGDEEEGYAYSIVSQWAQSDPTAALAWLEGQATEYEKDMFEGAILESLIEQNPKAALAYVENSPDSENSGWILSRYASHLALSEPLDALEWVFEQDDPDMIEHAMMELLWTWPEDDLARIQARIEGIEDSAMRERIMVNLAPRLLEKVAEDDPGAVMAWVDSRTMSMQDQLRPQALSIWMERDPDSAVQWLQQQPDTDARRQMLETVMWQLPAIDIDLALGAFSGVDRRTRIQLVAPMITAIQQDRPSILQQWISELDDPAIQEIAATVVDDQAQLSNPEQFLVELDLATGDERIDKLAVLYRSFGSADTEKFEQWLSENPLTPAEEMALERRMQEHFPYLNDDYC